MATFSADTTLKASHQIKFDFNIVTDIFKIVILRYGALMQITSNPGI